MSNIVTSQLDPVQYYGPLEPYAYQIDNRPLQDLKQNVDVLTSVTEASVDNSKILSMAIGMAARGIAGSNIFVGRKEVVPATFILKINHGFLLQDKDASISDSRQFPHVGLQQVEQVFPAFTKPGTVNRKRCFTIQARFVPADTTISFYDAVNTNSSSITETGVVQYQVKQAADVLVSAPDNFVAADIGWVEILNVVTYESDTQLDPDKVTRVYFQDDILREYSVDTHTTTLNQTVFSGISVDATKALVFITGVYQSPVNYTVDNAGQITWAVPLAAGLTVDFVVLSGGTTPPPVAPSGSYDYQIDTHIATAGQDTFTGIVVDANYAFVFVNGVFQADVTRTNSTEIILPAPVPLGTYVDFVVTIGGIGIPAGGVSGESLHQTTTGPDWQREVVTIEASAAGTVGLLTTYTCSAIGFDPATDLYDGRIAVINNAGGFNAANWTNDTPNVSLQIGVTVYPVKRPGNLPLQLNDVYAGMLVRYRNSTSSFELLQPGNELLLSTLRFATETSGTPDAITYTPHLPIKELENGAILNVKVPGSGANTGTSSTLALNRPVGGALNMVIRRPGGALLKIGDIVSGTNAVLMFDATLAMLILLNPVIQSASIPVEFPGARRQTVIRGPTGGAEPYIYKGNTQTESWTAYTQSLGLDAAFPSLLVPYNGMFIGKGASVSHQTIETGAPNLTPYASFAAGYGADGAIDYIEPLPTGVAFDYDLNASFTGRVGGITSINYTFSTKQLVITYTSNHSWPVNSYVKLNGFFKRYQQHFNGIWKIVATTANSITLLVPRASGIDVGSPDDPDFANVETLPVAYVYANRNTGTGAITYGVSRLPPVYIDPVKQGGYSLLFGGLTPDVRETNDQHIFDINKMVMTVGTGAAFTVVQRVFLGEVYCYPTGSVSSQNVRTYAYNGRFTHEIDTSKLEYSTSTDNLVYPLRFNQVENCMGLTSFTVDANLVQKSPTNVFGDDVVNRSTIIHRGDYNTEFATNGVFFKIHETAGMYTRLIFGSTTASNAMNFVRSDGVRSTLDIKADTNTRFILQYDRTW